MAKVTLHPAIKGIRGKMGNVAFRTLPNGETQIIKLADMSNVKWSEAQQKQRQRMKEATAYAQAAMAEPTVRAIYEKRAAEDHRVPFRIAMSDYFKGKNLFEKSC